MKDQATPSLLSTRCDLRWSRC